ncbi:MAG: ABC transporter ATP-binding protein [Clostridia bacterium]|nr:ABC transporter ATP-binding protein [Clostridia bacterium]
MKKIKKGTLSKILRYTRKYNLLVFVSLLLSLVCVACNLYIPVLAGRAIDAIKGFGNIDYDILLNNIGSIIITAALSALSQWIAGNVNNTIAFRVVRDVRNDAMKKISSLPVSYIDSHTSGDIVSRVISDADNFAEGLLMGFTQFFTGIMTILGTLVFMIRISPRITPVVALLTPLSLFVASFVAKKTHNMFLAQSQARGRQTAHIDETVTNHNVIAAYGAEEKAISEFDEINEDFARASLKAIFFSSITNPSTRFVNNMIYAGVALTGALSAISGTSPITVGALTAFLNYSGQYAKPFNEISGVVTELQNSIACAERIFELIEAESAVPDKPDAVNRANIGDDITLENVEFSYTPDRELIKNLNLDVKHGEQIAIVGPTGCGKTTVINLLMRFYDVDSGAIKIDNIDIRDITRASLRAGYGMVLQETWIKTATVAENIALGKPGATREEIIAAAKSAYAHSFIKRLPKGYDTVISDEISSLSQGQKQLLCIARVMLSLPPALILDEATSSIDTRTEIKIRNAFAGMTKGRTSFIVAHRLSTVRNSDKILVMKDGKVIEQGTHTELMSKHGFYEKLYNSRIS